MIHRFQVDCDLPRHFNVDIMDNEGPLICEAFNHKKGIWHMATNLENLLTEIQALSVEDKQRLQRALAEELSKTNKGESGLALADAQYQQQLVDAGLLSEIKLRRRDQQAFESYVPVAIQGKPLSVTIIEERR